MRWTEGCNTIRFVTGRPDRNIHWFNKLNSPQLVRFTHRQPYYSLLIRLPAFSDARPRSWPAPFIMTLRSVSLPSQCDSIRTLIDMLQFYLESRYLAHRHSLFICLYERAISFAASLLPLCVSCPYLYGPRHWNWVSHLLIVQFRLVGFLLLSSVYRTRGKEFLSESLSLRGRSKHLVLFAGHGFQCTVL